MKKKILFVIDSLCSGGAEKSLVSLLRLFDYEAFQVDLMLFKKEGLYLPLLPTQVNVIDSPDIFKYNQEPMLSFLKKVIVKQKINYGYSRLGRAISLRNPIINKKFHTAQINWKWLEHTIPKLKKEYDVSIAYSQGLPTYYVAQKVNAKKKYCWINTDYKVAKYNPYFDSNYYAKFDRIVAVSEKGKDVLVSTLPEIKNKVLVIYDIISPSLAMKMANEGSGFQDVFEGIRILTIGRLVEAKGYDMAIEAATFLKQNGIHFKWYALGEGNLKTSLEKLVKENKLENHFIFLGTDPNPYQYLQQCDIYVQPSRFEGFGMAIAEARMFHKPIVATNFEIIHDQLQNEQNGIITEMSGQAVFEGIKRMIEDEGLRNKIISQSMQEDVGTEAEIDKVYALIS